MSPLRATSRLPALTALAAVAACATWAFWPLHQPNPAPGSAPAPPAPTPAQLEPLALDTAPFSAPLWIAPPPPPPTPPAPQPPPPPPPLRLQLVGIVVEEPGPRAVLYNPDTDTLHIAGSGEAVGRCTVERVTTAGVTLREGEVLRTLALRDEPPPGGPAR